MKQTLISFILIFASFSFATAQSASRSIKNGDKLFESKQYGAALSAYSSALLEMPDDAELHYKLGLTYMESPDKRPAINHFQKAISIKKNPSESWYFNLAEAFHVNANFDEAKAHYLLSDQSRRNRKRITELVDQCEVGIRAYSNPRKGVRIINMGDRVNSVYDDYLPQITADQQLLFFTSRRPSSNNENKASDGKYFEDIFYSRNQGGWTPPQPMSSPINNKGHDAVVGLSNDGQTMFIYHGENGGDIFITEVDGNSWSRPKSFEYNTEKFESSVSLSPDGKLLFFVSDRSGSRDIYMCSRNASGGWSKPRKLPTHINTEYDEDAPFMHPDGKTLYFSSKGKGTMGGYDVFRTVMDGGTFGPTQNLGHPVNTPRDDLYFVISGDGRYGYYSSDRPEGMGEQDLYTVRFPRPDNKAGLTLLKGKVSDESGPIEADVRVTDNETGEEVAQSRSNENTGEYLISLPSGRNYGILVERKGMLFHSENVSLPENSGYQERQRNISLDPIRPGAKVTLNNVFFATGSHEIQPESATEIAQLVRLMKLNPDVKVRIAGHTDNVGSDEANLQLSDNRAKAVAKRLVENGISAGRVAVKGFGSSVPVASNDTPQGRQLNRRTEFEIVE